MSEESRRKRPISFCFISAIELNYGCRLIELMSAGIAAGRWWWWYRARPALEIAVWETRASRLQKVISTNPSKLYRFSTGWNEPSCQLEPDDVSILITSFKRIRKRSHVKHLFDFLCIHPISRRRKKHKKFLLFGWRERIFGKKREFSSTGSSFRRSLLLFWFRVYRSRVKDGETRQAEDENGSDKEKEKKKREIEKERKRNQQHARRRRVGMDQTVGQWR